MSAITVDVLNVGHGDSILVRVLDDGANNSFTLLVDAGYVRQEYKKKTLEFLQKQKIGRLDLVVVTHPDKDHVNALPEIAKSELQINSVWLPPLNFYNVSSLEASTCITQWLLGLRTFKDIESLRRSITSLFEEQPTEDDEFGNHKLWQWILADVKQRQEGLLENWNETERADYQYPFPYIGELLLSPVSLCGFNWDTWKEYRDLCFTCEWFKKIHEEIQKETHLVNQVLASSNTYNEQLVAFAIKNTRIAYLTLFRFLRNLSLRDRRPFIFFPHKGYQYHVSSDVTISVLAPSPETIRSLADRIAEDCKRAWEMALFDFACITASNALSLVFHIKVGKRSVLLTGDSSLEDASFDDFKDAEVVKIPHHGGDYKHFNDVLAKLFSIKGERKLLISKDKDYKHPGDGLVDTVLNAQNPQRITLICTNLSLRSECENCRVPATGLDVRLQGTKSGWKKENPKRRICYLR